MGTRVTAIVEQRRYLVRATPYGFGVWDTVTSDWWVPRLDMSRRDAGEIVAELEARVPRQRQAELRIAESG